MFYTLSCNPSIQRPCPYAATPNPSYHPATYNQEIQRQPPQSSPKAPQLPSVSTTPWSTLQPQLVCRNHQMTPPTSRSCNSASSAPTTDTSTTTRIIFRYGSTLSYKFTRCCHTANPTETTYTTLTQHMNIQSFPYTDTPCNNIHTEQLTGIYTSTSRLETRYATSHTARSPTTLTPPHNIATSIRSLIQFKCATLSHSHKQTPSNTPTPHTVHSLTPLPNKPYPVHTNHQNATPPPFTTPKRTHPYLP